MKIPVLFHLYMAVAHNHGESRGQLKNIPEQRLFPRHVIETQKPIDHGWRNFGLNFGISKDRLDFRAKTDEFVGQVVVERLYANAVSREEKRFLSLVPNRETKHASQSFNAALAILLIEMDDDLGIGICFESMPFAQEFLAERLVVINFPVENDPDCPVLV